VIDLTGFQGKTGFNLYGATTGQEAREKRAAETSRLWDKFHNAVGDAEKLATRTDAIRFGNRWTEFVLAVQAEIDDPSEMPFQLMEKVISVLSTIPANDRIKSQLTDDLWSSVDHYKKGKEWNGKITGQNTFKSLAHYNRFTRGLNTAVSVLSASYPSLFGGQK
jgi:hypothetical protein